MSLTVQVIQVKTPKRITAELMPAVRAGLLRATIWAARRTREMYGTDGGGPFQRKVSAKTGRVYWTGPASPVGGYPAVRSGRLRDTTTHFPVKGSSGFFGVDAGASVRYAKHVHRTRPFLSLTVRRYRRDIQNQFAIGFRNAARRLRR